MMTNLFSIFDPTSNLIFNFSLNWLSTFIGILFIPTLFWIIPSRFNLLWNKIIFTLHKEFKILINSKFNGTTLMLISLFSIILYNNLLGLFPYIFTSTSHMVMTLSLALPLWITFMIFGWLFNTQHMFIHLVPQGTPSILMIFMVCIETISNFIRPGTLAVRLMANMIAGHLLMTLLGDTSNFLMTYFIIMLLMVQILLLLLECAVAIIQSYVFTVLTTLYSSEMV